MTQKSQVCVKSFYPTEIHEQGLINVSKVSTEKWEQSIYYNNQKRRRQGRQHGRRHGRQLQHLQ